MAYYESSSINLIWVSRKRDVVWKMQGMVSDSHALLCWNWNVPLKLASCRGRVGSTKLEPVPFKFPTQPTPHSWDVWSLSSLLNGVQVAPQCFSCSSWSHGSLICFLLILVLPREKLAMGMEGNGFSERDAANLFHCSPLHSPETGILSPYIWLYRLYLHWTAKGGGTLLTHCTSVILPLGKRLSWAPGILHRPPGVSCIF